MIDNSKKTWVFELSEAAHELKVAADDLLVALIKQGPHPDVHGYFEEMTELLQRTMAYNSAMANLSEADE